MWTLQGSTRSAVTTAVQPDTSRATARTLVDSHCEHRPPSWSPTDRHRRETRRLHRSNLLQRSRTGPRGPRKRWCSTPHCTIIDGILENYEIHVIVNSIGHSRSVDGAAKHDPRTGVS